MPILGKSTVILVLVIAAFLFPFIPKHTVANDNADAKGARIGKLDCTSGEIAKFNGSEWVCSSDENSDTLDGLSCNNGEIAKFNGSEWVCSADEDTLEELKLRCDDGQVAQFNDSLDAWECADVDGGGGPSPCPAGFVELNANVCIEITERDSTLVQWFYANLTCINDDYRLCTIGEWHAACVNDIISEKFGNWEWTGDFAVNGMTTVGYSACTQFLGQGPSFFVATFRCCLDR
jgi:hypothetical protein